MQNVYLLPMHFSTPHFVVPAFNVPLRSKHRSPTTAMHAVVPLAKPSHPTRQIARYAKFAVQQLRFGQTGKVSSYPRRNT
jgi:hypothetical protein